MPVERPLPAELIPHVAEPLRERFELAEPLQFEGVVMSERLQGDRNSALPPLNEQAQSEIIDATRRQLKIKILPAERPAQLYKNDEPELPFQGDGTRFNHPSQELASGRQITIVAFGADANRLSQHYTSKPSARKS